MCGIFGYVGKKKAIPIVLEGLKKLEYRGYDSAGIAFIDSNKLVIAKEVGKISALEKLLGKSEWPATIAIGHTRWATHGKPSKINAHPHVDGQEQLALVHNGIIENYEALRSYLLEKGLSFYSETDTEVVAKLIGFFYDGDLLKATKQALAELKGAFSLAILHKDHPDQIIACSHEAPLVIGLAPNESYLSSDITALAGITKEAVVLAKGEIALIKADHLEVYNSELAKVEKRREMVEMDALKISKGDFDHYTLKEIFEQPQTVKQAMLGRIYEAQGTALFDDLTLSAQELIRVERILIVACGTSYYAGLLGALYLEDLARIPTQVEIASEYRYKNPVTYSSTLVIAISQSGETADTLASVRELKTKGSKILAICNTESSSIVRESDSTLLLRAGPEIGVCSTKAFTSQVVVLALFALFMARMRHMGKDEGQKFLRDLQKIPDQLQSVLNKAPEIERIAKKYSHYDNFFFVGRSYMFPASLEGALKLKEISYINANGYPAGELKHGPIALINENTPTVALAANRLTFDKIVSNLQEIKARSGPILAIATPPIDRVKKIVDDIIEIPENQDALLPLTATCALQLIAYYVAKERGEDIDHPKNLAKSVTVE